MKTNFKILLVLAGTFIIRSQLFAQTPDFSGTWVLNFEKSTLEQRPEGLTGSIFIIKQTGDEFHLTRYHMFGSKKKKISFKMPQDGKTRRVKIFFKGKLERQENGLQATLWNKSFTNSVNYRFGNSENELVADEVFTGRQQDHHNIWVFDRKMPE